MTGQTVTLFSHGLLSKWGFDDGNALADTLWDWADSEGISWRDIDVRAVLVKVVRQRLLPALDQHVEVHELITSHNPIRAASINGVPVADAVIHGVAAEPSWRAARSMLTPDRVDVPVAEVIAIARQMIPIDVDSREVAMRQPRFLGAAIELNGGGGPGTSITELPPAQE